MQTIIVVYRDNREISAIYRRAIADISLSSSRIIVSLSDISFELSDMSLPPNDISFKLSDISLQHSDIWFASVGYRRG